MCKFFLRTHSNLQIVSEICWILAYYIESDREDKERISRVVGLDVMTVLLPYLGSKENKIIRPLLQLLIVITSADEEFFKHVIDATVIGNLKKNLKSVLKIIRTDTCHLIHNLADAGSELYARVFEPEIIDLLIDLALNDPSAQVKGYAINALYKLIEFSGLSSINYLLINCDIIGVFLACIQNQLGAIQISALNCIDLLLHFANLLQKPGQSNEIVVAITQKGGVELIEVLCQSNNEALSELANRLMNHYFSS